MTLVSCRDLVFAASNHGLHVHAVTILTAVQRGDLEPARRQPLRFTVAEANRWLTSLAADQARWSAR